MLAANNQNDPNAANQNDRDIANQEQKYSTQQKQATSFSSDAFIKKNAAKAYAAKKRAMDRMEAGKTPEQRKLDAQKGFARRQSLKQAKKLASVAASNIAESPAPERSTTSIASSVLTTSDTSSFSSAFTTSNPLKPSPTSTTSSAIRVDTTQPLSLASLTASVATVSASESLHKSEQHDDIELQTVLKPLTETNIVPTVNQIHELTSATSLTDRFMAPSEPRPKEKLKVQLEKPSLSIENLNPMNIGPIQPASAPPPLTKTQKHMSSLPAACSADISTMSRMSNVSSCTSADAAMGYNSRNTATSRNRETVSMPSSGKWCPECAGVGLHVAALLTELAQWRADDERRSSQSSSNGASTTPAKSGWKRMMSQTLIGESRSTRGAQERNRLQQQVDVLTTTVQFLYEKLHNADAAGADVRAAFERCGVRSTR